MDGMIPHHATAAARSKRARTFPKEVILLTLVAGCVTLASHFLDDVHSRRGGGVDISWVDGDRHYSRILASPVVGDFESSDAESPYSFPRQNTCDEVVISFFGDPSSSESDSYDGQVNSLRRTLAMDRPSCYERHFRLFADRFLRRIETVRRHLTLNIPEAGGTSLCRAAMRSGFETFPRWRECWESPHFDLNQGTFKDPWTVLQDYAECAIADERLPEFVMNQNYINLPLCTKQRIYSLTLRDVTDRATSQEGRLARLGEKHKAEMAEERLFLLRNNYLTWSLTSSLYETWGGPPSPPEERRLNDAKRALMNFDFLLEEARDGLPDSGCNAAILRLMGFNGTETLPKGAAEAIPVPMEAPVSGKPVEERNGLDVKLVEFGRRLLNVDCAFFERVASLGGNSMLSPLSEESHPAAGADGLFPSSSV